MADLGVNLMGITLDNPIMTASGTFGFGREYKDLYDLNLLGSIVLKGTTKEPRYGNPLPRIAECSSGMLNAVGLENPGIDAVILEELPNLQRHFHKKAIANVCGFSTEEYLHVARAFDKEDSIGALEINVSCPNVKHGGMHFGTDPDMLHALTKTLKKEMRKPLVMKLSPNVTDIAQMAKACEDAGADGVSLVNTFLGMRIDLKKKKPLLANETGGLSGPAIFPLALRAVYACYKAVKIPIIGIGGIQSCEDVLEMMMAGASAVQIGATNLVNPYTARDLVINLPETMEKYGIGSLQKLVGCAHKEKSWEKM